MDSHHGPCIAQFEAAAKVNGWISQEMATSLVISLRGQALEILQSSPEEQQNDYDRIFTSLKSNVDSKEPMSLFKNTELTSNDSSIWLTLKHLKNFSNKLASRLLLMDYYIQKCSKLCGLETQHDQ
ncbi:hypothetical protein NQ318_008061 [Aromia moschata]|uniref:Uncharacterized protein n=1 Tax=Aromia moschata TaxID=1265417 RepID=A0AAV8YP83_9CUCU|nr:hypothetical protein NQ318_008061 [Aromia moschata]